jgi:hypothetical protein
MILKELAPALPMVSREAYGKFCCLAICRCNHALRSSCSLSDAEYLSWFHAVCWSIAGLQAQPRSNELLFRLVTQSAEVRLL